MAAADLTNLTLDFALNKLGYDPEVLKDGQKRALISFTEGKDTLVVLPTGYGKSLIYQGAPFCSDFQRHAKVCCCGDDSHVETTSIAIVISPLIALMTDQVKSLRERGISAINLTSVGRDEKTDLAKGNFSIVFGTPESLLKSGSGILQSPVYRSRVCGVFVDEGHCVAKWGFKDGKVAAFRKQYGRLSELRSFLQSDTPMFCLTATASPTIRNIVTSNLGLTGCFVVQESPERPNIRYSVHNFDTRDVKTLFIWLEEELKLRKQNLPKVLVFCKLRKNCSLIHDKLTSGDGELEKYVDIFHAETSDKQKDYILDEFVKKDSEIRVLLVTSAFGMGVNVLNLHTVIHYSPSRDIDDYFQESGRVGRDNVQSYALVMNFRGRGKGVVRQEMKTYVNKRNSVCRRKQLMEHYGEQPKSPPVGHNCCDVCALECSCTEDGTRCSGGAGWAETEMTSKTQTVKKTYTRPVTTEERDIVRGLLMQYQQSLIHHEGDGHLYAGASITSAFPTQLINQIISELHTIGDTEDLESRFPFFNVEHVHYVWNIIEQICESSFTALNVDSSSDSDTCSSDENVSEGELSIGDIESDDTQRQQEVISSQYSRVTLVASSESSSDEN